jgi:hypothetical protein
LFSTDETYVRRNEEIEMVSTATATTTATVNVENDEKTVTGESRQGILKGDVSLYC